MRYDCELSVPSERFRTLMPYLSLYETTHWIAASTLLTSAEPSRPAIFTDTNFTSGATPVYAPPELAPLLPMRPAMNVPWPYESLQFGSPEKFMQGAVCSPRESVVTFLIRPARSPTGAIPVSISATVTPLPV